MKNSLLFFLLLSITGIRISSQTMNWTLVNTGTTKNIRDISFVSKDTGIIAGDNGLLKYTVDGGNTWTDMALPATGQGVGNNNNIKVAQILSNAGYINGVLFFNKFTAVNRMSGWNTSWMPECGGAMFSMHDSVCSIHNFHQTPAVYDGYTAGSSCTHQGGTFGYFGGFCFTFDTLISDTSFAGWMDVTSNSHGSTILVGEDGNYALGAGTSFAVMNSGNNNHYQSVDWSDTTTVYAITNAMFYPLQKSLDGGNTFYTDSSWVNSFYYPQIAEMDFTDNDWGVMAGTSNINSGIIVTKRGNSFDFFQTDSVLTSVFVIDSTLAFAGGINGKLYKYDRSSHLGLAPWNQEIEFSIFPNPQNSSDETLSLFTSELVDHVMICDLTGKIILDKRINAQGNIKLYTGIKNTGTYIIRVFTQNGIGTKKYIVN